VLLVAVHNHYKRLKHQADHKDVELLKVDEVWFDGDYADCTRTPSIRWPDVLRRVGA
jgi:hypothetical protein